MEKRKKGLKKSRRTLLASCLSVVLCAALLVGATFALFTDEETANVQLITIGNLKVSLVTYEEDESKYETITEDTTLEFTNYEDETAAVVYGNEELVLEEFYVKNESDVAVTYTIAVTAPTGDAASAVTEYSITVNDESYTLASGETAADSITVAAADETNGYTLGEAIVLTANIDESDDISEYMGQDVGKFVITVTITQASDDDSDDDTTTE